MSGFFQRPSSQAILMAKSVEDKTRRRLVFATSAVGAVGAVAVAIPFVKSMSPSERAKAAGAPVEVDISKLEPGAMTTVEWRGKPVWIMHRTAAMIEEVKKSVRGDALADPESKASKQPRKCDVQTRSIKPELFVAVGICTHLGCSPVAREATHPDMRGAGNGFYCPCHGSRFDLAARVLKGSPAPSNLEVPPHKYLSENLILIGEEDATA
jgi:ubiquinol-cytochrome c reductase iron-sulfur subunit